VTILGGIRHRHRRRAARGGTLRRAAAFVVLCAAASVGSAASAADSAEFWPEASLYYGLGPQTRLFLNAAYAEGKESDSQSLDLAAYLDISVKRVLSDRPITGDWQRSRAVWVRIGYDRIFKSTAETGTQVAEDRGIVAVFGKIGLPAGIWLESRVRADLRWIGDEYSTRYRYRAEVAREFTLAGRPVVPYVNVEWFYDTRFDGWARTLYQAGPEVTVSEHFRYEIYFAHQVDRLPEPATTNAMGLVAKWYF
jgi:hypothetical protein